MSAKLEPRRLHYFMEVLNSGSVRGAAGALGMDASAVSRALGLLEKEYGARLLERRGRGVAPTDAGQLLAAYLHRQQGERQALLAQMDSIRKVESGHIELVTGEGYVDWLARSCLCRFMQTHPKITISLDIGSTDEIVQQVVGERAHIGVLFNPPRDDRLRSHHSQPHPIRAVVPRGFAAMPALTVLKRSSQRAQVWRCSGGADRWMGHLQPRRMDTPHAIAGRRLFGAT